MSKKSVSRFILSLVLLSSVAQPAAGIEGDPPVRLSSDGRMAVFVRSTPDKLVQTATGEDEATELWTSRADGTDPRMRLRGRSGPTPQETLARFRDPQFSPDGRKVYFLSSAWVTSSAVHALDLKTGKVRYVCPGNSFEVISRGEYAGHLMVEQHRYFLAGGSYDWLWLVTPDGRDVGPITGDEGEDGAKAFRELFIPTGNASRKTPK